MSDPFKGQPAKPDFHTPSSKPVKLAKYNPDTGGAVNPGNPDANDGYSEKLPRK